MEKGEIQHSINALKEQIGDNTGFTFSAHYETNKLFDYFVQYGSTEVYKAFSIATGIYFDENNPQPSLNIMLSKVGGILYNRKNKPDTIKWERK